jgi:hypothetical protein
VLNVGWLGHSAVRADHLDDDVVQRLVRFCEDPIFLTRGSHCCGLCHCVYGNGEIWIPGDDGRVYASPVMLAHYVMTHRYLPPPEFLSAVTAATAPLTEEQGGERIYTHRNKLENAPELNDILIPRYSIKIYWKHADFDDLTAFYKFTSKLWDVYRCAVDERGYFFSTESDKPDELFHSLAKRCERKRCVPFQCAYKLLYVGGEEVLYPTEPLSVELPNNSLWLTRLSRWLRRRLGAGA